MSLQPFKPVFFLLIVITVVALVWAVGVGSKPLAMVVAAIFPLAVSVLAAVANWAALTGGEPRSGSPAVDASQLNAELLGYIFLWGGLAMFAVYTLTQLWWFHSWQYGLAMLVLAAGLFAYSHLLDEEGSVLRQPAVLSGAAWLALAHGVAAIAGLAFLFSTGKLSIPGRTDWAANLLFLFGGSGIAIVSLIAAAAFWRLSRTTGRTAVNGA